MENQKSGTGKTVAIVILLLAVIGLGGYVVYDKVISVDKTKELKSEIKSLKSEINNLKNDTKNIKSEEVITELNGYYKEGQTYSTEENPCDAVTNPMNGSTTEILFNINKTWEAHTAADCGGGYGGAGTYQINETTLILTCTDKEGPCAGAGEYKINADGTITNDVNKVLSKVEKSKLQLFK